MANNSYREKLNKDTIDSLRSDPESFTKPTVEWASSKKARKTDDYVPYQSNNANPNDFEHFVQEQCINAVNAFFTGNKFKSVLKEADAQPFTMWIVNNITQNPEFMVTIANRAYQEVENFHYLPFDKRQFIEKARNENSAEFKQLNSAISDHVHDMCANKKHSFNREFDELSRPLIINIENLYITNAPQEQKPAADKKITEFIKENLKEDKPARVLADTFAGTFIEKTKNLVAKNGDKIFAGLVLACSIINPVLTSSFKAEDFVNITNSIVAFQQLKGNKDLKTSRDSKDTPSFYSSLSKTIQDNPQTLNKAISQATKSQTNNQQKTQSASMVRK